MSEDYLYVCLNCGFKFRTPVVEYRQRALNPGRAYCIDPAALYYPVFKCPRCGSDAIERVPSKVIINFNIEKLGEEMESECT